ncbi:PAS domain S-box protein [uncultured Methanoregula sp.]|uniref:PAS domain S-box protein n=1 Tax=uncultured Methanoregula sp. TaxID=1005933 RepID=UPI002AAB9FA0|nr:PAS domain S-box protein [uncultured Methanoregula sp.]
MDDICRIKDLLKKDRKGLNIREISETLKINRNSVAKLLDILTAKEEVEIRTYGRSKIYCLAQRVPLSDLMNLSKNFILTLDEDFRVVQANDAFIHHIDIPKNKVLHSLLIDLPTDLFLDAEIVPAADAALGGMEDYREVCIKSKTHDIWYKITFTPTRFQDLSRGVILFLENITERKRIENALRDSEEKYRTLAEHTCDILYSLDAEGCITYIGPQISRYGHTQGYFLSQPFYRFISSEDCEEVSRHFRKHFSFGGKITNVFRKAGSHGGAIWFESNSISQRDDTGAVTGIYGVLRDITERKMVEAENAKIYQWQEGFNRILQSLLTPVTLDEKFRIIADSVVSVFSADFCRIWLIERGDLCNDGCMHTGVTEGPHACHFRDNCLHLKASSGRYAHIDGHVHRRIPYGAYKIGLLASGDESKFLTNDAPHDPRIHDHGWARAIGLESFAGYQLKPPGGRSLGVFAIFARHRISPDEDTMLEGLSRAISLAIQKDVADKALKESELFNRGLVENLPDYIAVYGEDGKLLYVNPASARALGYDADTLVGTHVLTFVAEEYRDTVISRMASRRKAGDMSSYEIDVVTKSGARRSVIVKGAPLRYRSNPAILLLLIDITGRKRAEDALRKSEHQLDAMAANIPGVICRGHVTPDGTLGFDYISRRSREILGLDNDPVIFFARAIEGIVPEDRERFLSSIQHAIRNKSLWEFEGRYIKPSGETIRVDAVGSPVMENGQFIFDGVIFDTTDRNRAEPAREQSKTSLRE